MTREEAIAEIEAAGGVPVLSSWLKARSSNNDTHVTVLTPAYWEAKPGEVRACVEHWLARAKEREEVFASGDRDRIRAWMSRPVCSYGSQIL